MRGRKQENREEEKKRGEEKERGGEKTSRQRREE